jgi:protein NrfD
MGEMMEFTSTRHNPLVDPHLGVWSWEIPIYLFLGGVVAGLMILGGLALLRVAKGDDSRTFYSWQAPLLAFALMNVGMLALLLDLTNPLHVWRVYTTFQPESPMSWGSWVLLLVYGVLLISATIRIHESWPRLARVAPAFQRWSDSLTAQRKRMALLGWVNLVLGAALGIYTGILLNTMVARPLWNSAILAPLFLVSGLSTGAALLHVLEPLQRRLIGLRWPAPGQLPNLLQQAGPNPPGPEASASLVKFDQVFLVAELGIIVLLIMDLANGSASKVNAAALLLSGPYAWGFWMGVVAFGLLVPLAWQGLMLTRRVPHSAVPAVLVLIGVYALRWIAVNAGQLSEYVPAFVGAR